VLHQKVSADTDRQEKNQSDDPLKQALVALYIDARYSAHHWHEGYEQKICDDEVGLYGFGMTAFPESKRQNNGKEKNTDRKGICTMSWVWHGKISRPQTPNPIQKKGNRGQPREKPICAELLERQKKSDRGNDRCDPGDHGSEVKDGWGSGKV